MTGEEEPVWLTPHLMDSQPEGERERDYHILIATHLSTLEGWKAELA